MGELEESRRIVCLELIVFGEVHANHPLGDVRIRLPAFVVDFVIAQVNVLVRERIFEFAQDVLQDGVELLESRIQDFRFALHRVDGLMLLSVLPAISYELWK